MTTERPDDWHLRHCAGMSPSVFDRPPSRHPDLKIRRQRDEHRWDHCREICAGCPVITHCEIECAESDAAHGRQLFQAGKAPVERTEAKRASVMCRICQGPIPPNRKTMCSPECAKVAHNEQVTRLHDDRREIYRQNRRRYDQDRKSA